MKFLFVFDISFDFPGASVHILQNIMEVALNDGNYVDVILKKNPNLKESMPIKFIQNSRFKYTYINEYNNKKNNFVFRYIREIIYTAKCKKIYKKKQYDSVFLQSCNTALFAILKLKSLHCPIIYNVQDIFPYNLKYAGILPASYFLFPIFRYLQNLAYKKCKNIITISDDMKNTLIADGVPEQKISVIYNWSYNDSVISLDNINKVDTFIFKDHLKDFKVVYAGNIGKVQNVEIIVKAALNTKDLNIHYYIIGDGTEKKKLINLIKDRKNVTVVDFQNPNFAESIYAQADINLITLKNNVIKTAMPSKTATCLRAKKPIIFCIGENSIFGKEVSAFENIFVIDSEDAKSLSNLIIKVYNEHIKNSNGIELLRKKMSCIDNPIKYIEVMKNSFNRIQEEYNHEL